MRSIRRRREVRALVRKAKGQGKELAPAAAPPAPAPATVQEFFCRCGKILRVAPEDCNQTFCCPACMRKMIVHRVGEPGLEVLRPAFKDENDARIPDGELLEDSDLSAMPRPEQDDTDALTAIVGSVGPDPERGPLDDAIEPEPPKHIGFFCPGCRAKLVAARALYDRRARCNQCGSRVLINLVYDRAARRFTVRLVRLGDASSGRTGVLPSIP